MNSYPDHKNAEFLERNQRGFRVLLKHKNILKRLFYIQNNCNEEMYIGSSLKSIFCAGTKDFGVITKQEGKIMALIDETHPQQEYKSLKFSFHKSGRRHLRCIDMENNKLDIYKQNFEPLIKALEPQMLLTIVSKHTALYADYTKKETKDDTNAIVLDTPDDFGDHRTIFECYISPDYKMKLPTFIIPEEHVSNQIKSIKLKDGLFLHLRYLISRPTGKLVDFQYADREILLFPGTETLHYFSFK